MKIKTGNILENGENELATVFPHKDVDTYFKYLKLKSEMKKKEQLNIK